ncbi:hypothetical protein [Streptococcus suis]|uniref:hypothetical protein n=1 Tax=Streptococcus suis TaxID=1307 RepID=UPI000CF5C1C4|nr:hypothetical protein [Streptococcus suis]
MSLDNATLSYISDKLSTVFSGQKLASLAGEYCVISTISPHYRAQGQYESKAKFIHRVFNSLETNYQVGLFQYYVQQSSELQSDSTVQQLLARLSYSYEVVSKKSEVLQHTTEIERLLSDFPECLELWKKSQSHYQSFRYRESLDNARLCVELFLKFLLGNSKSLENQRADLGRWLGERNVPNEIENMVWNSIAKYSRVQNEHIKHDVPTELSVNEVIFVLDQTYSILKYLARTNKKEQS